MSKYVDGFVIPVPKENLDAYRELAELAAGIWRENGALEYVEYLADDVQTGEATSFPQAVKLEDNEVVVFSYIVYESREQRDAVNEKSMKDPRMPQDMASLPIDGKRLIWGGFKEFIRA